MKQLLVLRLYALTFLFTLAWVLLGAPIMPAEWQDIPHRLRLMFAQLPTRAVATLLLWR